MTCHQLTRAVAQANTFEAIGNKQAGKQRKPERARWHDPVLGRWLGLTPEQPALCLGASQARPRVVLSRFSDPPGLGRRQGSQKAARGTKRAKNVL